MIQVIDFREARVQEKIITVSVKIITEKGTDTILRG